MTASAQTLAVTRAAVREVVACGHCGLAVPAGRLVDGAAVQYCCAGCEVVHAALSEHGLDSYYALAGDDLKPARTTGKSYVELDDPAFHALHVRVRPDGLAETALYLEEVRCTACVWLCERTPSLLPGVVEVRLDFGRARADVIFDAAQVKLSAIAGLLDRLGHPVHPYRGLDRDAARRREDRALMLKIGVAGAAAGNVMLLAIALYAGIFGGMGTRDEMFFRWTSMIVAVPALLFAATPFFRGAIGALRSGRLHLDLPIALGIAAGLGWGSANTVRGVGEIYFDSLGMLVFLLLVGRWVQSRQHRRAVASAELLYALTPRVTRRFDASAPDAPAQEVPLEAVTAGDRVEIRAGETVPVDGEIVRGRSAVDAGLLTGESRPVDVEPGMRVHAGTVNLAGVLEVVASATGEQTRVGQLVARIEDETRRRAPIQRFVDRVAGRFVAVILAIAAITLVAWAMIASVNVGLERAMALLIVTCPCALALATPLAVTIALGRAARRGLLVKGGDALERLAHPGRLFLDKTGTLTEGAIQLVGWDGADDARALAAAVEAGSAHPLARALVAAVHPVPAHPERGAEEREARSRRAADDIVEELGHGLRGRVDGHDVAVGSPRWIASLATVPAEMRAAIDRAAAAGETPVAVAIDGTVTAIARFADRIRDDAAASIAHLRAAGWDVQLLSGDDPRIVTQVGARLGLAAAACHGGVTPEGKLAAIRDARALGPVVMVGDGVNDAAALAAATCGIAVHGSAEASVDAADVFVRRPGLAPLVELFDGSRATLGVIRRNLKVSLAYNLTGGTLAVLGLIHPLIAAVMMPLSSLSVLFSSSRTRGFASKEA